MKVINKGPERMRVPTREELRMEIKKLKRRLGVKAKKGEKQEEAEKSEKQSEADMKENMSEVDNGSMMFGEADEKIRRHEESLTGL